MKKILILLVIIGGVVYWRLQEPLQQLQNSDGKNIPGMTEGMKRSISEWEEAQKAPEPATEQERAELESLVRDIQQTRARIREEEQERMEKARSEGNIEYDSIMRRNQDSVPHEKMQRASELCHKVYYGDYAKTEKCYNSLMY